MIRRALVPLLVAALLLCHGAFGPADPFLPTGSGPVAGHLTLAGSTPEQEGTAGSEDPDYYYAVALLLAAGALFWARLARARSDTPIPLAWVFDSLPRPVALQRSRGPTIILLRVLRL